MTKIYVPATSPDDWQRFLKEPSKHWKTGFSAKTLAYCWHDAKGLPIEINQLFVTSGIVEFSQIEVVLVFPEWITRVAGGGEPPYSDVFVLAKSANGHMMSITVEGKVDESFGISNQSVSAWKQAGNTANRRNRLEFLLERLALSEEDADNITYQLVQRTASAVVEADRFNAKYAVMIVQSFSQTQSNVDQFHQFVGAFGKDAEIGQLVEISQYKDIRIFAGWAQGHERYLEM